ncbi:MAG: hypothetical protein IPO83_14100 [Chitinophagaceae bacterium]|nr:hypothetical protein [Chitinophagaceae bacterium]
MEKVLHYYYQAQKDVRLNSIPHRKPDGTYKWCNGQLEILNGEKFKQLRLNNNEVEHLTNRKTNIKREMLVYQNPTGKLSNEGERLSANYQPEIDDEELTLRGAKSELRKFEDDMLNRGVVIPDGKAKEKTKKPEPKKKSNGFNFKTIFSFLGIWLVGEIFMTYVQWNGLRNDKGIEDMVVRSLSFGVILFLVHLVAHFNRNRKRLVYPIFIGFSLLMLMTMLFAPLLINKAYPAGDDAATVSQQWSLTNAPATTTGAITTNPFWIEFYRENEMIPAILCFLFFVAMQSFMNNKKKEEPEQAAEPEEKPESLHDHILRRREYLTEKISESESRLKEFKAKQRDEITNTTGSLQDILVKLEAMKNEWAELDKKIAAIKTTSEEFLTDLEIELNEYSVEFLDVLNSDEVKHSLVSPEWQTRNDISNFYKIQIE